MKKLIVLVLIIMCFVGCEHIPDAEKCTEPNPPTQEMAVTD